MTKQEVYEVINQERAYQDSTYPPDAMVGSGLTRRERDAEVMPHILLLESYAQKAREAWVSNGGNFFALQQIAKAAAIAVRALERVDHSDDLLNKGLR